MVADFPAPFGQKESEDLPTLDLEVEPEESEPLAEVLLTAVVRITASDDTMQRQALTSTGGHGVRSGFRRDVRLR